MRRGSPWPPNATTRICYDRIAALRETLAGPARRRPAREPAARRRADQADRRPARARSSTPTCRQPPPPDKGLAQLVGVGPEAADELRRRPASRRASSPTTRPSPPSGSSPSATSTTSTSTRRSASSASCRSSRSCSAPARCGCRPAPGAFALYQFDRREVLRYTAARPPVRPTGARSATAARRCRRGSRANTDFHSLFTHFVNQVALFWRDKRISDVIRERAYDPSFGSIAIVRRAGLDLRNNLKFTSFGHLNVLRVEVMQLLDEAFRILNADDVKRLFGADNAWDVVEEVLVRYFNERLVTSPRQRMAVAGREVLRWLAAAAHPADAARAEFEALLLEIAEYAEEWLTSAQSLGLAQRSAEGRLLWGRRPAAGVLAAARRAPTSARPGAGDAEGVRMGRGAGSFELELQRRSIGARPRRGRIRGAPPGPARAEHLPRGANWIIPAPTACAAARNRRHLLRPRRVLDSANRRHAARSRARLSLATSTSSSAASRCRVRARPRRAPGRRAAQGGPPGLGRGASVPRRGSAFLGDDAGEGPRPPSGPRGAPWIASALEFARRAGRRSVREPRTSSASHRQRPAAPRARPAPLRALARAPVRARRARARRVLPGGAIRLSSRTGGARRAGRRCWSTATTTSSRRTR